MVVASAGWDIDPPGAGNQACSQANWVGIYGGGYVMNP